jgi:hypothetical protein
LLAVAAVLFFNVLLILDLRMGVAFAEAALRVLGGSRSRSASSDISQFSFPFNAETKRETVRSAVESAWLSEALFISGSEVRALVGS